MEDTPFYNFKNMNIPSKDAMQDIISLRPFQLE